MIRPLLSLILSLQLISGTVLDAQTRTILAMKTGVLLRMHVVAQDDSPQMQRIKLCVRDAVRQTYAATPANGQTMLRHTRELLPELTCAARKEAQAQGFTGQVSVSIENHDFDQRTLDGLTFPAGVYPALMIRLGEARGHNWWGLIDPDLALACADVDGSAGWDWSLRGFLKALLGFGREVTAHE